VDSIRGAIVDVETTMKCPVGSNKANPFWPENEIVLQGAQALDNDNYAICSGPSEPTGGPKTEGALVVAHNAAFDLHYLLKHGVYSQQALAKAHLWDTQLAEYLLSGQQHKFPSLDECAAERGGTLKDNRVSVMFEAGKGAEEVPRNMLEDYLKADLKNTQTVFWSQYKEAMEKGLLPLMHSQMDARLATIEMQYNGLAIDKTMLEVERDKLEIEVAMLGSQLRYEGECVSGFSLDPTKPQQLAKVLFGGQITLKEKEADGFYKNGKPKFKTVDRVVSTSGFGITCKSAWRNESGPSTADNVLEELLTTTMSPMCRGFIEKVQDYRDKSKQLSTYYDGISDLLMPDGRIHHNLNHCVTVTGRLSSSEPNLQNMTDGAKGGIKKVFVSRWGKDGYIVEADYSQLEMIVLAALSGDSMLTHDILTGTDMHDALYRTMHGTALSKEKRKSFKRCAFALVYGGGVNAISKQGKCSEDEARRFRDTFYARYPGVKLWHERVWQEVTISRTYEGAKDKDTGLPIGTGLYISPISGRHLRFREYVQEDWGGKQVLRFSNTETKNYPVQSGATADIVPLMVGRLYRVLRNNPRLSDKALLINTVHDNAMLDVHKDVLEETLRVVRQVLESAPQVVKETFGYDFPLPLKVAVSCGPNWFDQEEVMNTPINERKAA
jgi:DNA polymerase I-like protein with 3'-5' exonuclease and polymerase domains